MWQGKVYLGLSYLSISVLKRVPLDYRIWVFGVLTPTSATDECCCLREHLMWGYISLLMLGIQKISVHLFVYKASIIRVWFNPILLPVWVGMRSHMKNARR